MDDERKCWVHSLRIFNKHFKLLSKNPLFLAKRKLFVCTSFDPSKPFEWHVVDLDSVPSKLIDESCFSRLSPVTSEQLNIRILGVDPRRNSLWYIQNDRLYRDNQDMHVPVVDDDPIKLDLNSSLILSKDFYGWLYSGGIYLINYFELLESGESEVEKRKMVLYNLKTKKTITEHEYCSLNKASLHDFTVVDLGAKGSLLIGFENTQFKVWLISKGEISSPKRFAYSLETKPSSDVRIHAFFNEHRSRLDVFHEIKIKDEVADYFEFNFF